MTTIEFSKESIYIHGHSGYGTYGNDIVCAAISTLVESTYNYLEATGNEVCNSCGEGEFTIYLDKINETGEILIKSFSDMIDDLISQYPKYIERRNL